MANSEKIDEIIDEKAFRQLDDMLKKLGIVSTEFAKVTKGAIDFNNALGNSKSVSDFNKAQTDSVKAMNEAVKAQEKVITTTVEAKKQYEEVVKVTQQKILSSKQEKKALESLSGTLEQNIRRQVNLKMELSLVKKEQQELSKQNTGTAKSNEVLAQKTAELTKKELELKSAIQSSTVEIKRNIKESQLSEGSDAAKAVRLDRLRSAYRELSEEEKKNVDIGGQLQIQIKKLSDELVKSDEKLEVHTRKVGDYENATKNLKSSLIDLIPGASGVNAAFEKSGSIFGSLKTIFGDYISGAKVAKTETEGMTIAQKAMVVASEGSAIALKVLRVALISTGIGAIIVLLGSLVAYFASTQEGIDKVTSVTRPLVAIFQSLLGVLQDIGKGLVDAFSGLPEVLDGIKNRFLGVFTNPKKALSDLINYIKDVAINRFKGLGLILEGIIKLDFKKITNGYIQVTTGVENITGKIQNATKATKAFFDEAIKKGQEIDRLQKEIVRNQTDFITSTRLYGEEEAKLMPIIKNTAKSFKVRTDAAEKLIALTKTLGDEEANIVKKKIEIEKIEQSTRDKGEEGRKTLVLLQTELDNANDRGEAKKLELQKVFNGLEKEQNKLRADEIKRLAKLKLKADQDLFDLEIQRSNIKASNAKLIIDDERNGYDDRINQLEIYYSQKDKAIEDNRKKELLAKDLTESSIKAINEKANAERLDLDREVNDMSLKIYLSQQSKEDQIRASNLAKERDQELLKLQVKFQSGDAEVATKESYEKQLLEIKRKYAQLEIDEEIKKVQKIIDISKLGTSERAKAEADLAALKLKYSDETTNKIIGDSALQGQADKQLKDLKIQFLNEVKELTIQLVNASFQRSIDGINLEIQATKDKAFFEKEQVQESLLSADEKAVKLAQITAKQAFDEDQLNKKKRKIAREQAIFQKAVNAANVIQATALAIISALGPPLGPVIGAPVAITVGAIGAVQLATILATPIPAFRDGGIMQKDGFARFSEVGQELRIEPDGTTSLTPKNETVGFVKAGTEFISNKDLKTMKLPASFSRFPWASGIPI